MIIYFLLDLIFFILNILATLFGDLIPSFPSQVGNVVQSMTNFIIEGFRFLSFFIDYRFVSDLIAIIISWYAFLFVKDNIMKVVGHFFGN